MKPSPEWLPTPAASPPSDQEHLDAARSRLLRWFAEHGRDLPWRRTRDPWCILVAEVMLHQVQVVRALAFYEAFLERFPTVHALAAAPLAEAIRVWGDLGRYRRVVNLHRAAGLIVAEHGGQVPADVELLRKLPGVGPYTAGAVACFAFEQDVAFADTNIRRVLRRVFVGAEAPEPAASTVETGGLAAWAVPAGGGWAWNQALMDLGATVCTARRPGCGRCPVRAHCRAHPTMLASTGTSGQRRSNPRPADRYEGSNRYYRGRVLARLREHSMEERAAEGIPLRDLGGQIRPDFGDDHVPWLRGIVASLAKDGLAVAEEAPADRASEPDLRVRLPA